MNVPSTYDDLFYAASQRYDAPFSWLKAIAGAESDWTWDAFRPEARINDGSYGLMQILMRTARGLGFTGTEDQLYDPETNINLGAKLIDQLRARSGDDFSAVYSAYNSGSPTAYKTNSEVAAHVNRAWNYLKAVEAVTAEVTAPDPGSISTGAVIGTGAVAFVIGFVIFLATRGR